MKIKEKIRLRSLKSELTISDIKRSLAPLCESSRIKSAGNCIELEIITYEDRGEIDNIINKLLK